MKSKKTTRRALFSSIMALILCCAMLVGSTFAWFTDSVTSVNNVIKSGNLDVEVYYGDPAEEKSIQDVTTLFNDVTLWEPGAVAWENLTVANVGTLALKYELAINFTNENTLNGKGLSQILKVAVVENGVDETADRDAVVGNVTEWKEMKNFKLTSAEDLLAGESVTYGVVIYWEPSANDNDWNVNNGKTTSDGEPLHIDLGVNLFATQKDYEEDSFGKDYDENAGYGKPWDGTVGEVPAEVNGVITITSAEELAALAKSVNEGTSYSGKTIELADNIDLANVAWTPIGACDSKAYFQGTFDGKGYTISNLNVDKSTDEYKYSTAGLFGWIDAAAATIKNVNVDGATVKGSHWVGVIVGYMTGEISNCSVTNATVVGYNVNSEANGDKVGGLVGYVNSGAGKLDGNTVSNSTVIGYRDVAGLAGAVVATNTVTNNSVNDVAVYYSADYAAEIVSKKTDVVVDETNKANNVTVTKALSSDAELDEAIKNGVTELVLGSGNYIIPDSAQGKTLTITGTAGTVLVVQDDGAAEGDCDYSFDGSTVTFENLTITTTATYFPGYVRMKGTYKNCTINGVYTLYDSSSFENCTFNISGDFYNIWTWGASTAEFKGCTFNSSGKAILHYGGNALKLTVENCVFNDDNAYADVNNKAAIEVGSDWTTDSKEVVAENCTVNGFDITDKGLNTGSKLWGNKNSLPQNRLNVVIDGVEVY